MTLSGLATIAISLLISAWTNPTFAGSITVGNPANPNGGKTEFSITNSQGITDTFSVTTGAGQGASALLSGLLNQLQARDQFRGSGTIAGNTLTVRGDKSFQVTKNPVQFKLTVAEQVPVTPPPGTGRLSFEGNPGGVTYGGQESSFASSLGFSTPSLGEVVINSSLTFGQLGSPTTTSLLVASYDQLNAGLPPQLRSNLLLNVPEHSIDFRFPDGSSGGFVTNFSSDITTEATEGITAVPEPSSLVLLSLGLIGMFARRWDVIGDR